MTSTLQALQIGGLAHQTLQTAKNAVVMGVTSKGMFLNAEEKILFVTAADYKSPFNIQIPNMADLPTLVSPGDSCVLDPGGLIFTPNEIRVDVQPAVIWQPEDAPMSDLTSEESAARADRMIATFCEIAPDKGWLFLSGCLGNGAANTSLNTYIDGLVRGFTTAVQNKMIDQALTNARSMIGLGGGLTPSGDDWLTGFFLFHHRYILSTGRSDPWSDDLAQRISEMAVERTTKISANRIAAARLGWAEEMFVEVVDHFLSRSASLSEFQLRKIVEFGHSSGVDTCMGILGASQGFEK